MCCWAITYPQDLQKGEGIKLLKLCAVFHTVNWSKISFSKGQEKHVFAATFTDVCTILMIAITSVCVGKPRPILVWAPLDGSENPAGLFTSMGLEDHKSQIRAEVKATVFQRSKRLKISAPEAYSSYSVLKVRENAFSTFLVFKY